jgi:hypothetical protein
MQGNSMLAFSRHFVAMLFYQLLVGFGLLASLFLLQISDPHFTIEFLQQTDIACGKNSICPLFVPGNGCLEHFRSPPSASSLTLLAMQSARHFEEAQCFQIKLNL